MPSRCSLTKQDIGEFSLQKYVGLKDFTMQQWHMLLMQRRLLWWQISLVESGPPFAAGDPESVREFLANPLGYASSQNLYVFPNIRPVPDAYKGAIPADPNSIDGACFGMLDGVPLGQLHRNDADGRRVVHLEVDMDASNDELISNFVQWVFSYRDTQGESTVGTKGAIRPSTKCIPHDWINAQLIPYIDLQIAARIQRLNLADKLIQEELFPGLNVDQWIAKKKQLKRLKKRFFEADSDAVLHQLDP